MDGVRAVRAIGQFALVTLAAVWLPGLAAAQCVGAAGSARERSDFVALGVVTDVSTRRAWSDLELTYAVQVTRTVKGEAPATFSFTVVRSAEPSMESCGNRQLPRLWPRQEAVFYMGGSLDDLHAVQIDRIITPVAN